MNHIDEIKKNRIIRRILKHSEIFSVTYLNERSIKELKALQKSSLIELMIKMKFHTRHNRLHAAVL